MYFIHEIFNSIGKRGLETLHFFFFIQIGCYLHCKWNWHTVQILSLFYSRSTNGRNSSFSTYDLNRNADWKVTLERGGSHQAMLTFTTAMAALDVVSPCKT